MRTVLRSLVILTACLSLASMVSAVAGGGAAIKIDSFTPDMSDHASLQRGARTYMNYCSGCHSLEHLRYERMARDIGITHDDGTVAASLVKANLMFTADKIGEHINTAMRPADAAIWFGVAPPDLSLMTRAKGPEWVYNYLIGFYDDPNRPWGVNNAVFKDVAMPHVLFALQGEQQVVHRVHQTADGKTEKTVIGVKQSEEGKLTIQEYRNLAKDLVNFMAYAADPVKEKRERLGVWVILFLVVLLVVAYLLKREYWKDVH